MHISQLHIHVEGAPFSMKFVKENGEVVAAQGCICTSWYSAGNTMNVRLPDSGEIRKVRRCTVIEFNGREVYL